MRVFAGVAKLFSSSVILGIPTNVELLHSVSEHWEAGILCSDNRLRGQETEQAGGVRGGWPCSINRK